MGTEKQVQPRNTTRIPRRRGVVTLASIAGLIVLLGLQTQPPAMAQPVTVGFIPDQSGVSDDGWNSFAYQGLLRAESELGVVGTVYTPTDFADYGPKLQQCVDDGNDLCISSSFLLFDATMNAANSNPGTLFGLIDVPYDSYPDNLRSMIFASDEAGYLAGTLAGLMSQSDVIGAVAGVQILPVVAFADGYKHGAQCSNPAAYVLINYTGTFVDRDLGAQVAQDMITQGADVIFGVGGLTGVGAVLSATQSGVWGIGVDFDWYVTVFEDGAVDGSDKLLTSAMKRVDNVVFYTISDVVSGTFTSGATLYDLEVDGVGLAPFHEADPWLDQSVRDALDSVAQGIIAGTIDPGDSCRTYIYLPMIVK